MGPEEPGGGGVVKYGVGGVGMVRCRGCLLEYLVVCRCIRGVSGVCCRSADVNTSQSSGPYR